MTPYQKLPRHRRYLRWWRYRPISLIKTGWQIFRYCILTDGRNDDADERLWFPTRRKFAGHLYECERSLCCVDMDNCHTMEDWLNGILDR